MNKCRCKIWMQQTQSSRLSNRFFQIGRVTMQTLHRSNSAFDSLFRNQLPGDFWCYYRKNFFAYAIFFCTTLLCRVQSARTARIPPQCITQWCAVRGGWSAPADGGGYMPITPAIPLRQGFVGQARGPLPTGRALGAESLPNRTKCVSNLSSWAKSKRNRLRRFLWIWVWQRQGTAPSCNFVAIHPFFFATQEKTGNVKKRRGMSGIIIIHQPQSRLCDSRDGWT